jgi:hypothetical protein
VSPTTRVLRLVIPAVAIGLVVAMQSIYDNRGAGSGSGRQAGGLDDREARLRRIAIAATFGICLGIALSAVTILGEIGNQWGEDYRFFMKVAERWVATGQFFNVHQLAGPYQATSAVDVLYPPIILFLLVPFLVLPAFLWWALPLGAIVGHVVRSRPAWWTWPLLAILLWIPRSQSIVIWGNTTMWIGAFVALGLRYGWPSVLVAMKPSFLPLMFIGVRHRSWWIALGVVAGLGLVFGGLWFDFIRAMTNNKGDWPGLLYSIPDLAFVAIPIVAWIGRTTGRVTTAVVGGTGAPADTNEGSAGATVSA